MKDLSWMRDALCAQVDPELFFPDKSGSSTYAKKICNSCPVQRQCLQEALATEEDWGVWGGVSGRARRKFRKPREKAA